MQKDRTFRTDDGWALATDGLQWVLQRKKGNRWDAVSFVRTTKDILARCMWEKGVPADVATRLLDGLPGHFETWLARTHPPGSRRVGLLSTAYDFSFLGAL